MRAARNPQRETLQPDQDPGVAGSRLGARHQRYPRRRRLDIGIRRPFSEPTPEQRLYMVGVAVQD